VNHWHYQQNKTNDTDAFPGVHVPGTGNLESFSLEEKEGAGNDMGYGL